MMYATMLGLLNRFYPERTVTVTSADPQFVTPTIKVQLRRKNRLMRSGRTEEAGALAKRIRSTSPSECGTASKRQHQEIMRQGNVDQGTAIDWYSKDKPDLRHHWTDGTGFKRSLCSNVHRQ